jgi:hypothetical protein
MLLILKRLHKCARVEYFKLEMRQQSINHKVFRISSIASIRSPKTFQNLSIHFKLLLPRLSDLALYSPRVVAQMASPHTPADNAHPWLHPRFFPRPNKWFNATQPQ